MKIFVFAVFLVTVLSSGFATVDPDPCTERICTDEQKATTWPQEKSCFEAKAVRGGPFVTIQTSECGIEMHKCNLKESGVIVTQYRQLSRDEAACQMLFYHMTKNLPEKAKGETKDAY